MTQKKYRDRDGQYLLEGIRLISDAIKSGAQIDEIFVREGLQHKLPFDDFTVVSDRVFAKISDTVHSQGVVAVARKPQVIMTEPQGDCMVFDGLQDPGNAGTLIRTAVACGFSDIYAVNSVDLYSPKVLRSAMSAHFCVKLHESYDASVVFELLRDVRKIAADMSGKDVFHMNFDGKVALILGNEGNGLSEYTMDQVDETVSLPMSGKIESLNVAVAGSVIAYQIFSQRR